MPDVGRHTCHMRTVDSGSSLSRFQNLRAVKILLDCVITNSAFFQFTPLLSVSVLPVFFYNLFVSHDNSALNRAASKIKS